MAKPETKADQVRADRQRYVDELAKIAQQKAGLEAKIEALDGVLTILDASGRRKKGPIGD